MTIRTIVFENGVASIGIGGGITIDSVATDELAETKLKARALLLALGSLVA
jgi:anthranilate/para-aminobenzoate synthase component I